MSSPLEVKPWTDAWVRVRGRHPFFLLHGPKNAMDDSTIWLLSSFLHVVPDLCPIDVILDSPGGE